MKITRAILNGYKRFRLSNIQSLNAQFPTATTVIVGTNGSGKALRNGTKVITDKGHIAIDKLNIGDKVLTINGTFTPVINIARHHNRDIYRIYCADYRYVDCDEDHLWAIVTKDKTNKLSTDIHTTKYLVETYGCGTELMKKNIYLPTPLYASADTKIRNNHYTQYNKGVRDAQYYSDESYTTIPVHRTYHHVDDYTSDMVYFKGIADTIGNVSIFNDNYCTIFIHTYQDRCKELINLCRVLGAEVYAPNNIRDNEFFIKIGFYGNNEFFTSKELTRPNPIPEHKSLIKIAKIVKLKRKFSTTCIEVEHPSKLYVLENGIVTHNSSFMRELCPLPAVRTDYYPGGSKEIHIEHENHNYTVSSNFNNKTSPHSFKMNGKELNIGGTTDVQTELVEKHFGITSAIRNLIYSKVSLCNTTRAERKNLFLNINPMELGLILDAHKRAVGRIKDAKAVLTMLNNRKAELESRMWSEEVMIENIKTKQHLTEHLSNLDKLIFALEKHVSDLKNNNQDEIAHYKQSLDSGIPLVNTDYIKQVSYDIRKQLSKYRDTPRGEELLTDITNIQYDIRSLTTQKDEFNKTLTSLIDEINEYQKLLDVSSDRTISTVEQELKTVDTELSKFDKIPDRPIRKEHIDTAYKILANLESYLYYFRDSETKMIPVSDIVQKKKDVEMLQMELNFHGRRTVELEASIANKEKEITSILDNSKIPSNCTITNCMLKNTTVTAVESIRKQIVADKAELTNTKSNYDKIHKKYSELKHSLEPYDSDTGRMLEQYEQVAHILRTGPFQYIDNWTDEVLIDRLNTQPIQIYTDCLDLIKGSQAYTEYEQLKQVKTNLVAELEALAKTNGASIEFLQKKLADKNLQLEQGLATIVRLEQNIKHKDELLRNREAFRQLTDKVDSIKEQYEKGMSSLIVVKAIKYWNELCSILVRVRSHTGEKLRELESLVRDQEVTTRTYKEEILVQLKKAYHEKELYEKIEIALSPTTGLPHKSMVAYLNAMINNVNFFLENMWSYKMRIIPLAEDQPIDYNFRIEVGNDISNDISQLSDGQMEVVNLAWMLTILSQLRMLDKIPLFADEIGRTLDPVHRMQILAFLGKLIDSKTINQLFIVNHYALFTDGFSESDVVCLNKDNIPDLPKTANEFVTIS